MIINALILHKKSKLRKHFSMPFLRFVMFLIFIVTLVTNESAIILLGLNPIKNINIINLRTNQTIYF